MAPYDPYDPPPIPRLERDARLRLFEQLHQSPDLHSMDLDGKEFWRRGNGYIRCTYCLLPYRDHPLSEEGCCDRWDGPLDRRLCSGNVVHL